LKQWRNKPEVLKGIESSVLSIQDEIRKKRSGDYEEQLRNLILAHLDVQKKISVVTDVMVNGFLDFTSANVEDDHLIQWAFRKQLLQHLREAFLQTCNQTSSLAEFSKVLKEEIRVFEPFIKDDTYSYMQQEFLGFPLPETVPVCGLLAAGHHIIVLSERDAPKIANDAVCMAELLQEMGADVQIPSASEIETTPIQNAFYQLRTFFNNASLLAGASQAVTRGLKR
jgi:hypothetical protein